MNFIVKKCRLNFKNYIFITIKVQLYEILLKITTNLTTNCI